MYYLHLFLQKLIYWQPLQVLVMMDLLMEEVAVALELPSHLIMYMLKQHRLQHHTVWTK